MGAGSVHPLDTARLHRRLIAASLPSVESTMKMLYVTELWSGFRDLIFDGKPDARGMAAFVRPLREFCRVADRVDIVVAVPPSDMRRPIRIAVDWLRKEQLHLVAWSGRVPGGFLSLWSVLSTTRRMLRQRSYDVVYGHGHVGAIGCYAARRLGVPCGGRLYGTFLAEELRKRSPLGVALRHPLGYLAFALPKDFLIVTDDGTQGDFVHGLIGPPARNGYEFHFRRNGVDRDPASPGPEGVSSHADETCMTQVDMDDGFLFYPARIARWKRQHMAVQMLKYLHERGHADLRLVLAGHVSDATYWNEVQGLIRDHGLEDFVEYRQPMGQRDLLLDYRRALAVLSLYETSNLGNVVIEAMSAGALVVAQNDGSLDGIVEDGVSGILVDDAQDAATRVERLIDAPGDRRMIRAAAHSHARRVFLSWDARIREEVEIVRRAAEGRPRASMNSGAPVHCMVR